MDQWHGVFLAAALIFAVAAILFWQRWCDEALTAKADSAEHVETRNKLADCRVQLEDVQAISEQTIKRHADRIRELEVEAASWEKAAQESADRNRELLNELSASDRMAKNREAATRLAATRHCNELHVSETHLREAVRERDAERREVQRMAERLKDAEILGESARECERIEADKRRKAEQERDRLASDLVGMIAASKRAQAHLDALKTPMQETSDTERFVMSKPKCLRTSAPCEDYASVNEFLKPGEAERKDA